MTEFLSLTKVEHDPKLDEIDPVHMCADCGGHLTVGDYRASGICSECYWFALETGDFE